MENEEPMKEGRKGVCHAIRGFSVALGSPHANRVNASESDRVGHRNSGAHLLVLFFLSGSSLPIHDRYLIDICNQDLLYLLYSI